MATDYLVINPDSSAESPSNNPSLASLSQTAEPNPFLESAFVASPPPSKPKPTPTVPLEKLHAVIDTYQVNGGLDSKWVADRFPPQLKGYLSYTEFECLVNELNAVRQKYRSTRTDFLLLGASALLLPMVPFLARKKSRAVKRHHDLNLVAGGFSGRHPNLRLRFDKLNGTVVIEAHPRALYG
eukprot:m.19989 g.19989  ORF g.19989 m.19989 type:complete len:183 (-) comp10984_c0_seq1:327-875(-)